MEPPPRAPQDVVTRPAPSSWLFGENPAWLLLLVLALYIVLGLPNGPPWSTTPHPCYNYLADAFLHGQLYLRGTPPITRDLVLYGGHYYLYWPPMPAIVLMPFVAIFGVGFSDVLFSLAVGLLNVWLVFLILRQAGRRGLLDLSAWQRGVLVLFFALGTVQATIAPYGLVWFTGSLFGFLCLALAYLAALSLDGWPAFLLTGLGIAAAALTRNHLFLAGLWPAVYLLQRHWPAGRGRPGRWRLVGYAALGLLPLLAAGALTALYNTARFGSPLDVGLDYHLMDPRFYSDYARYGPFHLHYLPINLFYHFIAYPYPIDTASFWGGSLFLLSPVFFGAFWALVRGRPRWHTWTLLATMVLVYLPIGLLMGTGVVQFGPRYTLDLTVPLLLLTALGVQRWPRWALLGLAVVSIVHYLLGSVYLRIALS